jgi:hypothetical protein
MARSMKGSVSTERPWFGRTDYLVVRDHHGDAELAADAEALLQRVDHAGAFVAHVGAIDAVVLRERATHFDHFLGRRRPRWLVIQACRDAYGASLERLLRHGLHPADFTRTRRTLNIVHGLRAQHGVSHKQHAVRRGRARLQLLDVGGEGGKAEPSAGIVEQIDRRQDRRFHASRRRRKRDAAVAGDHRGHALAHLGGHVGRGKHQPVVVGVGVDEAGRHDEPRGVNLASSLVRDRTHGRDPVPGYCHIGAVARRARPVDDGAVAHDEVVAHQSTLAPERRTTSAHFGVSLRTRARNSSGVPPSASVSSLPEALEHERRRERLADLGVQPRNDLARQVRRRDDAAPGDGLIAGDAGLVQRRQVGEQRRAARPGDGDAAHPAGARVRADRRNVVEHELHFAGDEIVDRLRAAAIGNVKDERPCHRFEELAAEVAGGAVAARGHDQAAGILPGVVDQLLHRPDRQLVVDREQIEDPHAIRHQREVLLHVVGHLFEERAVDGERHDVAVTERVAVGGGPDHVHRAEGERGARLVLDHERRAHLRR